MTEEASNTTATNNLNDESVEEVLECEELTQVSQTNMNSVEEEPVEVLSSSDFVQQVAVESTTEKIIFDPLPEPIRREKSEPVETENKPETPSSAHRTFAPLNIPLSRRRQTLTILVWFLLPWTCFYITFLLLRCNNWYILGAIIAYLTWMMFLQKYPREGGYKQQWLRRSVWWRWFAEYFPIHLHKTCDLPADRPYIFGYHPHGIISLGAFCNFATEATGFEEKYPNINLRLLTLSANFRIPFYGQYLSCLGLCDASKESCNYILSKGNGNSIMLVLGGAKESLDAHPSNEYLLTLKNRKGFIKIGLANGASLVPVFSFGENDLYEQVANPLGSRIRRIQIRIQKRLGYAIPFFKGRGIFQYAVGFLPNRHPIDTYVGAPIALPRLERDQITPEIVDRYHNEYVEALKRLFDTYKAKHGNATATIRFVDDNE